MIFYDCAHTFLNLITAKKITYEGTGACYLGLCTAEPSANGNTLHEIDPSVYPSYERILLNAFSAQELTSKWGDAAKGTISNEKPFSGDSQCEEAEGWPECSHWVIFNAKEDGIPMVGDVFRDPEGEPDPTTGLYPETTLRVEYKKVPVFRKGALQLTLK